MNYYASVLSKIPNINHDTILSLISFKLILSGVYYNALNWYNNDIASILLPHANLSSQNISKILNSLGAPVTPFLFIRDHLNYLKDVFNTDSFSLDIDSTAIDNEISLCYSRTYYHGTERHHGFRIIAAVHIPTGLPIYYEIIHGNVIDQCTLDHTVEMLKNLGCKITHISGDAGFGNINNLERLI